MRPVCGNAFRSPAFPKKPGFFVYGTGHIIVQRRGLPHAWRRMVLEFLQVLLVDSRAVWTGVGCRSLPPCPALRPSSPWSAARERKEGVFDTHTVVVLAVVEVFAVNGVASQ